GVARADSGQRETGCRGGRAVSAGRGVQAAEFAIQLPGHGAGRVEAAAGGCGRDGAAGDHGGDGDLADRADAALYRLLPGGGAEYAELQSAARTGTCADAGPDEAGDFGDD